MATPWWDMSGAFTLYGVGATGLLALLGSGFSDRRSRDRDREGRTYDARIRAYEKLLEIIHTGMLIAERTDPNVPTLPPPQLLSDFELMPLNVLIDAHASRKLEELANAWSDAFVEWVRLNEALTALMAAWPGASPRWRQAVAPAREARNLAVAKVKEMADPVIAQVKLELHGSS